MERISIVDNSRQEGMLADLGVQPEERNIIIGCGGIGFWLGLMIAMIGGQDLVLMDGEKIDNSNLSRLPVPQTWVGHNKAVALRKLIRILRPDVVCTVFSTHITPDTLHLLEQFTKAREGEYRYNTVRINVWDTTDDARIQTKINSDVEQLKKMDHVEITYRKIGYEGFRVGSYKAYDVWTQEDYTTGYRTTKANAVSSALAAGLGFFARYMIPKKDVTVNLKTLIEQGGDVCKTGKSKETSGTQAKKRKSPKPATTV